MSQLMSQERWEDDDDDDDKMMVMRAHTRRHTAIKKLTFFLRFLVDSDVLERMLIYKNYQTVKFVLFFSNPSCTKPNPNTFSHQLAFSNQHSLITKSSN